MKKILALILTAVMLFSVVACGSVYDKYEDYISLDLSKVSIDESEILEKVAEQIETLREKGRLDFWVELDAKDAVAQNGDKLNIDFALKEGSEKKPGTEDFKISEETKTNMASEGYDLVLGSNSFIGAYEVEDKPEDERNNKGFEEQLIGSKVNTNETDDKVEVVVTFPDNYKTTELQGVIVTFVVTVNSISRSAADLTNEELIASLSYKFVDPDATTEEDKEDAEGGNTEGEGTTDGEGTTEGEGTTDGEGTTEGEGNTEGGAATADAEGGNTEGGNTEGGDAEGEGTTEGDEEEEDEDAVKFKDLFKDGSLKLDFSADEFGKFNTIFDIKTVFDALDGKTLYEEFDLVFTVPSEEDLKKDENEKFAPYAGREITVTFTLTGLTVLPEWNDEFVKKQTSDAFETVKAYEEYLNDSVAYELAYVAIVDAAVLKDIPEKEVKKLYKSLVESYITNILNEELGNSNTSFAVGDFTQKEYDKFITSEIYAAAYESAAEQAILAVKEQLVCEYLYDTLGISVSKKEYKEKIEEAYTPYKDVYKSLGINNKSDYVNYMYGGKDEAITALKYQKLSEMKKELVALITVNPADK